MVVSHSFVASSQDEVPLVSSPVLSLQNSSIASGEIRTLIQDFFSWFEHEWRQPVLSASTPQAPELLSKEFLTRRTFDAQKMYTRSDLMTLSGYRRTKIARDLAIRNIHPVDRAPQANKYSALTGLYRGQDLIPLVEQWEWKELCAHVDTCWVRFLQEPCGHCCSCQNSSKLARFHCEMNNSHFIQTTRRSFSYLLRDVRMYGDITSWWSHEQEGVFECKLGTVTEPNKVVILYLLDRHLLQLSFQDILRLTSHRTNYVDLLRPYRHRRPEEYASFLRALEMTQYGKASREIVLTIMAVMVFLKYGFRGLDELGRQLTPEEMRQAIRAGCLLTPHLGHGIYLGSPLSDDIRVGHVILDEIREYFWKHAAVFVQETGQPLWDRGPRWWSPAHINVLERVLTANVWGNGRAVLPARPETQHTRVNPYCFLQRAEQEGGLLPPLLREAIQLYVNYRYQEKRIELSTLSTGLTFLIMFFSWVKDSTDVSAYASWDRDTLRDITRAFLAASHSHLENSTLCNILAQLHVFFGTLAELDLPYPRGYAVLLSEFPPFSKDVRTVPCEAVLDRLFHHGVCQLDYDPFSRLALTIQYFCGTRITETCDLPVFCIVEDPNGKFAYLVIPKGKSKQERSFPIVSVGMGPLLDYMDQIVRVQVNPDGTLRNFSQMNVRYLETDPEKAYHWDYLFDRLHYSAGHGRPRQRVLSPNRVNNALQEAVLLAAKHDPSGFFQQTTYSPSCHRHRRQGQLCGYLALRDGVTVCPMCGGILPGKCGHQCSHRLSQERTCDGVAHDGSYFCPKCDAPLAELVSLTSHTFRHNSVTRAHRLDVPLAQNMLLHGHQTIPMHLRYLHLLPEDQQKAVHRVFSEKLLRDMRLESSYAPGQVIEDGMAHTATVEQLLGLTLRRELKRHTAGLWGGFWTGALADEGNMSPVRQHAEIMLTEDTYHHTVAQYRYEALGLAISEVALERGTRGKFKAEVAPFLERREIERVVSSYLKYVQQGYLNTARGVRLIEADIKTQCLFLDELAEMLRPWWQHLGSIDHLVTALFLGSDAFAKPGASDEINQEESSSESAS